MPQRLDCVVADRQRRVLPAWQQQNELPAVGNILSAVPLEHFVEHLLHRGVEQGGLTVKITAQHFEVFLAALQRERRYAQRKFKQVLRHLRPRAQRVGVPAGSAHDIFQYGGAAGQLSVLCGFFPQVLQVHALARLLVQLLLDAAQHLHDALRRKRFEQIIQHLALQRLLDIDKIVVTGQHDVFHGGIHLLQAGDHFHTIHIGHMHVGEHHIRLKLPRLFDGVDGAGCLRAQRKAAAFKVHGRLDALAHLVFVVHQHQLVHRAASSLSAARVCQILRLQISRPFMVLMVNSPSS